MYICIYTDSWVTVEDGIKTEYISMHCRFLKREVLFVHFK